MKTNRGEMAPITQFISLERIFGPQSVNRFNMYNSSKIIGSPADGYSTGDALNAIQDEPVSYTHLDVYKRQELRE